MVYLVLLFCETLQLLFFFFFFLWSLYWLCHYNKFGFLDAIILLSKIDDMMKEEAIKLREAIGVLHLKHIEYVERIQTYIRSHSADETEIKRLAGLWDSSFWTYFYSVENVYHYAHINV